MIDSGATHNFIDVPEAERLGLVLTGDISQIKTVNSKAHLVKGVARGVKVKLGDWSGNLNFTAVPLDDFRIVLGIDFLRNARVASMLAADCLLFMGEKPCCVPVQRQKTGSGSNKGKSIGAMMLSALQLKRGLQHQEPTLLAVLTKK